MRSWLILNMQEADEQFWSNIEFPLNVWGESAYEVRIGHRGRCKYDWDRFIEKSAFQIFYNPFLDKYRIYISTGVPRWIKVYDPDPIRAKSHDFLNKIEIFKIDKRDFTDYIIIHGND